MAEVVKVIGVEQSANTTANTFGGNKVVRLANIDTAAYLITHVTASGNNTLTLPAATVLYLEKAPTDLIAANTASSGKVLAVPVAYKY